MWNCLTPCWRRFAAESNLFAELRLLAHSHPGLQFARGTEQADARPFQFEIRVLQCVVALVGQIASVVKIVQS